MKKKTKKKEQKFLNSLSDEALQELEKIKKIKKKTKKKARKRIPKSALPPDFWSRPAAYAYNECCFCNGVGWEWLGETPQACSCVVMFGLNEVSA